MLSTWASALDGDGEELVGHVHQDAMVAQGMLGEGDPELAGHQRRVAGDLEHVVEAGAQLVSGGGVDVVTAADPAAQGQELGGTQLFWQSGVAGKDDAQELAGIEVLGGQDAELVEDLGERLLGLVELCGAPHNSMRATS